MILMQAQEEPFLRDDMLFWQYVIRKSKHVRQLATRYLRANDWHRLNARRRTAAAPDILLCICEDEMLRSADQRGTWCACTLCLFCFIIMQHVACQDAPSYHA